MRVGLWTASAGLMAMLVLLAAARWGMPDSLNGPVAEGGWTRRTRAPFTIAGVQGAQVDPSTGRSFSWTAPAARLRFPELPLSDAYRLTLHVRGGRPAGAPHPILAIRVDGVQAASVPVGPDPVQVTVTLPVGRARSVVLLETTPAFRVEGGSGQDRGVIVDAVDLAPVAGHFRPTWLVLGQTGLATAGIMLGLLLCGVRGRLALCLGGCVLTGTIWLLIRDGAFLGGYAQSLAYLGLGAAVTGGLVAMLRWQWPTAGGEAPGWSLAAGIVLGLSALKIALFWHPLAIVGDAVFQVHRAQMVHAGEYFFTSVTPRPFFEFPYAIALYVVAQPFWGALPSEMDLVHLLRTLCIVADGCVGVALYGVVSRNTGSRLAGLLAAALWPLARAPFEALSNANLTNLFGQAVFGTGLATFAWWAGSQSKGIGAVLIAVTLLTVGFLSHFGTLTVGIVILLLVGTMLVGMGKGSVRRAGVWLLALTMIGAALSWVVYYSHFTEVYSNTYQQVRAGERDDTTKVLAAPLVKFARWRSGMGDDYGLPGWPAVALAGAGLAMILWRRQRDAVSLILSGWLVAWIGLSALGILTPITLRANLAAAPAFVGLGAYALAPLAQRSTAGRAAAFAIAAVIAWNGLQVGLACIGRGW